MRVKWCRECGRLGAWNFVYCPFCGSEFPERPALEELVEGGLAPIEARAARDQPDRFERAGRRLDALERDLEEFLEETGPAGENALSDGRETHPA
jgi:hypothetical protein